MLKKIIHKNINILLLLIFSIAFSSCGGNECKYPENKNGIWQDLATMTLFPINEAVINEMNSYGAITLRDGATEAKARDNLWIPLKYKDGNDVKVEAGNQIRLNVADSVVLAGYMQTIPATLKSWINPTSQPYSFTDVEKTKINVSSKTPTNIEVTSTWEPDGTISTKRTYTVLYGSGDKQRQVSFSDDDLDTGATVSNECKTQTPSRQKPKEINYGFLYPRKIVFGIFPTSTFSINYNANLEITPQDNRLKCKIKSDGSALWYQCTFVHNDLNWEYKRRIYPIMYDGYPQYEEQINCTSNTVGGCTCTRYDPKDDTKCISQTCKNNTGEDLF